MYGLANPAERAAWTTRLYANSEGFSGHTDQPSALVVLAIHGLSDTCEGSKATYDIADEKSIRCVSVVAVQKNGNVHIDDISIF
jgi:hypothetical protein